MGRTRIQLDDGGVVEYEHFQDIVPIGNDRGVPARYTFTHDGGEDQPSFRFEFGVMDGIPVCLEVHIEAKDVVPVRNRDLKIAASIDKLVVSATAAVAYERNVKAGPGQWWKPTGSKRFNEQSLDASLQVVKSRPRSRRSRDELDLALVAETWNKAPEGRKTEALQAVFFVSKATAARYKKRAVDEGFLDE